MNLLDNYEFNPLIYDNYNTKLAIILKISEIFFKCIIYFRINHTQ